MDVERAQRKPVRLIAAACRGLGIGKDGTLPWHLPSEFKYFINNITKVSKPGKMNMLIWGKLCWHSNPEDMFPLANTLHVVLTNTLETVPKHAHFLRRDFGSAVLLATEPPLSDIVETIWVVGGTRVYKDGLMHPWCDLIYLTDVMASFDCDVFFPEFDRNIFQLQDNGHLHDNQSMTGRVRQTEADGMKKLLAHMKIPPDAQLLPVSLQ